MSLDRASSGRDFEFTWAHFDHLRKISIEQSGILVPDIKQEMFYSRLSKRLRHLQMQSFAQYIEYLESNWDAEGTEFINALTTNLTAFFRENHHFEFLQRTLVPAAVQSGQRSIRIWSAGCSTGEEPYSIAMTLDQACSAHRIDWSVVATDLDTAVLAKAANGVYPQDRIQGVPGGVVKRYFLKGKGTQAGMVRVCKALRSKIEFRQLNLIRPFEMGGPYDVIFCRNVVIYFDKETKLKLVRQFARHLQPESWLIMGHSESLNGVNDILEPIGQTIYRRIEGRQRNE